VKHVTHKAKTKASFSCSLATYLIASEHCATEYSCLDIRPDLSGEKLDPLDMSDSYRLNSPKKVLSKHSKKERILHEIPVFS
jgi:hypothetical protein